MAGDILAGRRVLVVEDEALIAMDIEDALRALGCEVVGPTGMLAAALQLASGETLDAAILDVSIHGGKVFAVAERLMARGVPFILASGYSDWALPEPLRDRPRLTKPFTPAQLEEQMRLLCGSAAKSRRA